MSGDKYMIGLLFRTECSNKLLIRTIIGSRNHKIRQNFSALIPIVFYLQKSIEEEIYSLIFKFISSAYPHKYSLFRIFTSMHHRGHSNKLFSRPAPVGRILLLFWGKTIFKTIRSNYIRSPAYKGDALLCRNIAHGCKEI